MNIMQSLRHYNSFFSARNFHWPQYLFFLVPLTHTAQMTLVQPSGEMSAKIREELREPDADAVAKDIAAIREWLEKQPHLPKDMGKWNARIKIAVSCSTN